MQKAPGLSSRLAPPSLTPSQPALQATVGMLNPPLPACGGASDHKPGRGAGGSPPLQRLRKLLHSGWNIWRSGLLMQALPPPPGGQGCPLSLSFLILKVGIKHPSGNMWTPHDFYQDHVPFVKSE